LRYDCAKATPDFLSGLGFVTDSMSARNPLSAAAAPGPAPSAVAPANAAGKGPANWPTHLRQFSRSSHDRVLDNQYASSPGDTASSNSTIRERPSSRLRLDRTWTVTVNESFARDEVLLNLDLIGDDIQPGSLVAIDVFKADLEKPLQSSHHKQHRHDRKDAGSVACAERRYICVAKDMPKELKARYSTVEVYVAKHVADAFGMRKGTQVTLNPVCPIGLSTWPYRLAFC